jgi:hypothetical protein
VILDIDDLAPKRAGCPGKLSSREPLFDAVRFHLGVLVNVLPGTHPPNDQKDNDQATEASCDYDEMVMVA